MLLGLQGLLFPDTLIKEQGPAMRELQPSLCLACAWSQAPASGARAQQGSHQQSPEGGNTGLKWETGKLPRKPSTA